MKDVQGTQQPICARIAAMQFYLRSVDLPPILGPVTRSRPWPWAGSMRVSLGMKLAPLLS